MNLLQNENETKKFINKILQPLVDDEVYLLILVTRKKYCNTITTSLELVTKEIIRYNDTDKIMRKIKKISNIDNLYVDKDNNIIPEDAFALYIVPEPRSMIKAYMNFTDGINKWNYENLRKCNVVENANLELYRKLDRKLFSAIHKSRSRSLYFIIDVDKKDERLVDFILNMLKDELELIKDSPNYEIRKFNGLVKWISETRGGYHIVLNINETTGKFIYKLKNMCLPYIEFRKETMTPVAGTMQGGFLVKEYITSKVI